ncbi:MAG: cation transporter [Hyphomicrobiales bacterium]|nr:cation transporter [Hyphomicrobiales bacterium]PCH49870.1 MAG: cation transporter [Hyphomicrobiales bacterium]
MSESHDHNDHSSNNNGLGCQHHNVNFDGASSAYKSRLWLVIAINAIMFIVEMTAGHQANSRSLQADALDFLGDSLTYGISLAVIGSSLKVRSSAALFKGISLFAMGIWVFVSTIWSIYFTQLPEAQTMGIIGFLALLANVASVLILVAYKDGDANVRSVWLCSRNDAIGNVAVMIAAIGIWGTATAWPDLIVAIIMAGLFISSAYQILRQALAENRRPKLTN